MPTRNPKSKPRSLPPLIITHSWLKKQRACPRIRRVFLRQFGKQAPLSPHSIAKVCDFIGYNTLRWETGWLMDHLFPSIGSYKSKQYEEWAFKRGGELRLERLHQRWKRALKIIDKERRNPKSPLYRRRRLV